MAKLSREYYNYEKLSKANRLTPWNEIKEGVLYHIPPIVIYDRRDFMVLSKTANQLEGKMRTSDGKWNDATLYYSELSTKFMTKLNGDGRRKESHVVRES